MYSVPSDFTPIGGTCDKMTQKICSMCGKEFEGGPRAIYCKECRPKRAKELDYGRRAKTAKRRIGDIDKCLICNAPYVVKASGAKYCAGCTEELKKQRKKAPTKRPLGSTDICEKCGKEYIVLGGKQRYCKACGKEVHNTATRDRKRAQSANNIGSTIKCKYCGNDFVKTAPKQYYCSACKNVAIKEIDRKQGLDYYNQHKIEININRKKKKGR